MQQRNNTITIMKALAIVCMVAGHAYTRSSIEDFVGMFHMPVFFFVSGFCFREKHLGNVFLYIKKKILALWWPTAKWLMAMVVLHNLLLYLGVYELHKVYDKTPIEYYGLLDILKYLAMAFFTLHSHAPSFAGIWFIKMLLIASVVGYFTVGHCCHKGIIYVEFFLLAVSVILLVFPVRIPVLGQAHLPFLSTFFYIAGYISRQRGIMDKLKKRRVISFTLSFVLLIIGFLFWTSSMVNMKPINCIPFCMSAFAGIIIIMFLADIINKRFSPPPHTQCHTLISIIYR